MSRNEWVPLLFSIATIASVPLGLWLQSALQR